jgi:hypothetical protein
MSGYGLKHEHLSCVIFTGLHAVYMIPLRDASVLHDRRSNFIFCKRALE